MTWGIQAIVSLDIGDTDDAARYFRQGYEIFARPPFYTWHEGNDTDGSSVCLNQIQQSCLALAHIGTLRNGRNLLMRRVKAHQIWSRPPGVFCRVSGRAMAECALRGTTH